MLGYQSIGYQSMYANQAGGAASSFGSFASQTRSTLPSNAQLQSMKTTTGQKQGASISGGDVAIAVIGSLTQVAGSLIGAHYQSQMAETQKGFHEVQARQEKVKAENIASNLRNQARKVLGTSLAIMGSRGFDSSEGSSLRGLEQSLIDLNSDIKDVFTMGETQANQSRTQARLAEIQAPYIRSQGFLGAIDPSMKSLSTLKTYMNQKKQVNRNGR